MKYTPVKKKKNPLSVIGLICIILGLCTVLAALIVSRFNLHNFCTVHYEKNAYEIAEEFHSLNVAVKGVQITLLPTKEDVCTVECDESKEIFFKFSAEDGVLTVTRTDERAWFDKIITVSFVSPSLTVYLPEAQYDTLSLSSTSGDVNLSGNLSFLRADVSTASGDVSVKADRIEELSVTTASGRIKLSEFTSKKINTLSKSGDTELSMILSDHISAESRSGEIRLSDADMTSLEVSSSSGKVALSSTVAKETASVVTNSGKVVLSRFDSKQITIKTDSGKVSGTLLSDKRFDVDTDTGELKLPTSSGEKNCHVRTRSGDVKLEILD